MIHCVVWSLLHSMDEVLVMWVRMVELERRTLIEGHRGIIRAAYKTEGTAGTEVNTMKGMKKHSKYLLTPRECPVNSPRSDPVSQATARIVLKRKRKRYHTFHVPHHPSRFFCFHYPMQDHGYLFLHS